MAPPSQPSRTLPVAVRRWLEFHAGKKCEECGRLVDGIQLRRHWDHIYARRLGGEDVAFNLQLLCHQCNLRKWARLTPQARAMLLQEERRTLEIIDYFHSRQARILGNERLREPQRAAYLAMYDHFVKRRGTLPAIVQIPTGCGKSGILCLAPFGIAAGRVLIVTPNLTIKNGIERELAGTYSSNFYLRCRVFDSPEHLPRVVVLGPHANRDDCLQAEIVVANVQQIQHWLHLFPSNFFDMVMVDEGHHVVAESWQRINQTFRAAKRLYITATPYRADGKDLYGEFIYSYSLAEAMSHGYVKSVIKVDAVPSRLTFHVDGETRDYTAVEINAMKEETWFSRGVALSETCNRSIVDKSIQMLAQKRRTGQPHQIIAAACSIPHAQRVAALYRGRGLRAAMVHSKMPLEERAERIQAFENGAFDAIIHVGILGEGYDHPPLSVAAIFRPFRTLGPYAQFIGRTLRRIPNGSPEDNVAHVVAHTGLNLDPLWTYFKEETIQAAILQELEELEEQEDQPQEVDRNRADDYEDPTVTFEEIARFDVDTFLPGKGPDPEKLEEILALAQRTLSPLEKEGILVPNLRELIRHARRLEEQPVVVPVVRPDLERHEYRKLLAGQVQKAAGRVALELGLGPGRELVSLLGRGDEKNNYQVVIRLLNHAVNRRLDKPETGSDRGEWTLAECQRAIRELDRVAREVREEIRRAVQPPGGASSPARVRA